MSSTRTPVTPAPKSYYTFHHGERLKSQPLKTANTLIAGQGDGRVSIPDSDTLAATLTDGPKDLTPTEKATRDFLLANYRFSNTSRSNFEAKVGASQSTDPVREGLSHEQLEAKATQYVIDHAATSGCHYLDQPGKLWPALDSGENGLSAYLFSGDQADKLVRFFKQFYHHQAYINFDPQKQSVIAVHETFDEQDLYISIIDHATGKATHIEKAYMVDTTYEIYEKNDTGLYSRIYGEPDFDLTDNDQLIAHLVNDGEILL